MKDFDNRNLNIVGYSDMPVPNQFLCHKKDASTLAVMFPGLHYTCDKPLLYYTSGLLLGAGVDVLQLKTDYARREFQFSSQVDRMRWILSDSHSAVTAGLEQLNYERLVLVGKSIGTLAIAGLVSIEISMSMAAIWLTPLLNQPILVDAAMGFKGPALYLVGTADSMYLPDALEEIRGATGAGVFCAEDADHSLEIPGDTTRSLNIMADILLAIDGFLNREGLIVK